MMLGDDDRRVEDCLRVSIADISVNKRSGE